MWVLEANGARCMTCAVTRNTRKKACPGNNGCFCVLPARYCHMCDSKLVPIGHARKRGAPHKDWPTRKYHKKCWKERIYDPEDVPEDPDWVCVPID